MTSKNGTPELVSMLQYMKEMRIDNPEVKVKDARILELDAKRLAGDEEIPDGDVPVGLAEYVHNNIELMKETPSQKVTIVSRDGVKLCGRFYQMQETAPVVLCFHGYRSSTLRDGMGAFQLGYNNGYNVLLLVPGADHGMSYAFARTHYQEMLYAFAEKYIGKSEE